MTILSGDVMKIVALGDSITEGYPFRQKDSWVEYAARELKIEIVNKGICGDLTRGMRERFPQDVLKCNPTHVIILGGANDAYEGYPLTDVGANFQAMVDLSAGHGIVPILGLPTPSMHAGEEKLLAEYRNWLKNYAHTRQIALIDFYTPFQQAIQAGQTGKLYVDEVHPSLEGYRLMGETAVQSLAGLLPIPMTNSEERSDNSHYLIEKGTVNDIDQLEALYNDLNDYLQSGTNYPGWLKGIYPNRETAVRGIQEDSLFVLRMNKEIAGSVILNHEPEAAYNQVEWGVEGDYKDIIVIHTLVVHPKYLKHGLGAELMEFAGRYSLDHQMKAIRLDVSIHNTPATALYEKCGYRYVGTVDLGLNVPGLVWFRLYELAL